MKHPHALKTAASLLSVAVAALVLFPTSAAAAPFFNAGPSLFDPEIDIVESGVINDVQATVSHDRKYVTLTMRPQQSQLLALREFVFTGGGGGNFNGGGGGGGFVGGVGFTVDFVDEDVSVRAEVGAGNAAAQSSIRRSPAEIRQRARLARGDRQSRPVLLQRGMRRVD